MRVNRAWLGLVVLMLPTLLVAMDMTALLLALPRLSADLGATSVQQLWISDSYGFMVAGLVITMGTLGDRIGRRRLLMIGAAAFAVLSVVAAFATSPLMLIVARALLGVAGATLAPSTLALITNMFRDERQRGQAIAIWATCQFTGGALGPVLAGFLLQHFWWGSVFLVGRAGDGVAAARRAGPAAGVPQRPGRPAGPGQRRAVARGGAADGLRHQAADRRERASRAGRGPRRRRSHRSRCSYAGSCGWRRRCWTCGCSATARSRPYSSRWSSPASPWPARACW